MNSNYFYSNIVQTSKNKSFLEEMQSIAESIKQQVYVLSGPLIDGKYQYNDDSLIILNDYPHVVRLYVLDLKSVL